MSTFIPKPRPLPYVDRLRARELADIRLLVVHCTELPDLAEARKYGEELHYPASGTGNSGHYYIDRDGSCECWVPPERIAHHVAGMNEASIGVELVNRGRWPDWFHSAHQVPTEAYPAAQIEALIALVAWLQERCPQLTRIAGHEDLDVRRIPSADDPEVLIARKIDPGPLFPWEQVLTRLNLQRVQPDSKL